jgi:hypothetical protein
MEVRHILFLEQVYCKIPYHVLQELDKSNQEAKYRAEPG